ncbi:MAG: VirB3 family type IV secretion system protein [Vitreimonas sp.]
MLDEPEGYRIALRTSLTRPLLMGGVPRTFAIMNATVAAAIALGLQQPLIGVPLWIIVQAAGAYASARDAWFLDTWPRAMAKPSYFAV